MARTKGTALVVDDDPVARLAVDRQLDALGWDAYLVNNGAEAVRLLQSRMRFDVLLIELRLTEFERRAVLEAAAYLVPPARAVYMGSCAPADRPAGCGLIKPFSTVALAQVLG